jgi:hypothetical protein
VYKNYTQFNCLSECFFYYAQAQMKSENPDFVDCAPWFLPTTSALPKICDPWEAKELSELMTNVPESECLHCLPDCSKTNYKTFVTAVKFRDQCYDFKNILA